VHWSPAATIDVEETERMSGVVPQWQLRRRHLAEQLSGCGVELGPGNQPFECPESVTVQYVDRWQPDENRELFPELAGAWFPTPDVVANFDTDRLSPLPDQSQDFVICAHVLEHLAEPVGFLREIYRVLRPGGLALVLLPDRHKTFDSNRPATSLAHLIAEYDAGTTIVDDDHIREFLTMAGPGASFLELPERTELEPAFFDWHRRRSVHVHCWDEEEFLPVLLYSIDQLGECWELVGRLRAEADGDEFGFLLRRIERPGNRQTVSQSFLATWRSLGAQDVSEFAAVDADP
jgi:SAM-dependent methyltransferase